MGKLKDLEPSTYEELVMGNFNKNFENLLDEVMHSAQQLMNIYCWNDISVFTVSRNISLNIVFEKDAKTIMVKLGLDGRTSKNDCNILMCDGVAHAITRICSEYDIPMNITKEDIHYYCEKSFALNGVYPEWME